MDKKYFNNIKLRLVIEAAATAAAFVAAIVLFIMKDYRTCAILAGVSVIILADLFSWMFREGMSNSVMIGEAKLDFDKAEQQESIERLSEPFTHNDDFLKGFAACLEYFTENYLMDENISVTERQFFEAFTTTMKDSRTKGKEYDFETYRNYMLLLLFGGEKITTDEYNAIRSYIRKPDVKKTLARVLYSKELLDIETQEMIRKIKEGNGQDS